MAHHWVPSYLAQRQNQNWSVQLKSDGKQNYNSQFKRQEQRFLPKHWPRHLENWWKQAFSQTGLEKRSCLCDGEPNGIPTLGRLHVCKREKNQTNVERQRGNHERKTIWNLCGCEADDLHAIRTERDQEDLRTWTGFVYLGKHGSRPIRRPEIEKRKRRREQGLALLLAPRLKPLPAPRGFGRTFSPYIHFVQQGSVYQFGVKISKENLIILFTWGVW